MPSVKNIPNREFREIIYRTKIANEAGGCLLRLGVVSWVGLLRVILVLCYCHFGVEAMSDVMRGVLSAICFVHFTHRASIRFWGAETNVEGVEHSEEMFVSDVEQNFVAYAK